MSMSYDKDYYKSEVEHFLIGATFFIQIDLNPVLMLSFSRSVSQTFQSTKLVVSDLQPGFRRAAPTLSSDGSDI